MAEQIVNLIAEYGLETVSIALLINLFTGVIKIPIKHFADKTKHSAQITRFIVFLPIIFGFVFSFLYAKFVAKDFAFGKEFLTLWLTSSSLSLTFYAVFEKLVPPKSKTDSDDNAATQAAIDKIQSAVNKGEEDENGDCDKTDEAATVATEAVASAEKIILRGIKDESKTQDK